MTSHTEVRNASIAEMPPTNKAVITKMAPVMAETMASDAQNRAAPVIRLTPVKRMMKAIRNLTVPNSLPVPNL